MNKKKIIWLIVIILSVVGLSAVLAYRDKLLPTGGYIYVLKPAPIKVPVVSGPMCGWCGGSCVNWKDVNARKKSCADVMPAPGYECVSENNTCIAKNVNLQTE
jgi:hypothetical protein